MSVDGGGAARELDSDRAGVKNRRTIASVMLLLSILVIPINSASFIFGAFTHCWNEGSCRPYLSEQVAMVLPLVSQLVGTVGSIVLIVVAKIDAKIWKRAAVLVAVVSVTCFVLPWLLMFFRD